MFENKKIFILGLARSGFEAAKLLGQYHNQIFVTDAKEQDENQIKELEKLGIQFQILEHPEEALNESYDILIKNPGVRKDQPCVLKAKELGIPVINEMEMAYHFLPNVTIIGITGSNGKTTTTSLLYEILRNSKLPVHLGGNIGFPLSGLVNKIKENDILVLEISDHQLIDLFDFKTDISILTNLTQVHLDFHGSYENYKNVKQKIFKHHTKEDIAIVNASNEDVMNLVENIPSTKITFSTNKGADCELKENKIVYQNEVVIDIDDIKLKGKHNYENIMCAIIAAKKLNVSNDDIKNVLMTFHGVEHRLEYVRTVHGVDYYNDAKATNTDSTIIALSSFEKPTILILGGLDRGHSFEPLNPYLTHVKKIVCYGETKERIESWSKERNIPCEKENTLKEAISKTSPESGDVVLFSPACASWDQYKQFEDRGDEFKKEINAL